jgi:hypothetical protein
VSQTIVAGTATFAIAAERHLGDGAAGQDVLGRQHQMHVDRIPGRIRVL